MNQWGTWTKRSQRLLIFVLGLCFWKLRMIDSCMFHSFYHVGLMQHVAGKHVFDSACTHEHTNRQNICRLLLKLFSGHCRHHFGLQTYGLQTYPQTEQIKAPPATFRVPCKPFKCQLECLMECHIHACLNMHQVECPVRWLEKMPDRLSSPPQINLIQITLSCDN